MVGAVKRLIWMENEGKLFKRLELVTDTKELDDIENDFNQLRAEDGISTLAGNLIEMSISMKRREIRPQDHT